MSSPSHEASGKWKSADIDMDEGLRWIVQGTLNRYGRLAMVGESLGYG